MLEISTEIQSNSLFPLISNDGRVYGRATVRIDGGLSAGGENQEFLYEKRRPTVGRLSTVVGSPQRRRPLNLKRLNMFILFLNVGGRRRRVGSPVGSPTSTADARPSLLVSGNRIAAL